jgi:hypothetical protein
VGRRREDDRLTVSGLTADGPPVRIRDLEYLSGLDAQTLRRDVKAGYLSAVERRRGPRYSLFLVERSEARRYLATLGISQQTLSTES